jgi:3-phenylpropionate/cinnamic acid dioxygenase small subunit
MQLVSVEEQRQIEALLYKEARLADESRYAEWEELVDDDMYYWVPVGGLEVDTPQAISVIADNRKRLSSRVAQLKTGMRHAQLPASPLCRVLSNIEIEKLPEPSQAGAREYAVRANSILYEMRIQSTQTLEVWPARVEYKVRADAAGAWKLFFKKVMLVNGSEPLSTLGFLI